MISFMRLMECLCDFTWGHYGNAEAVPCQYFPIAHPRPLGYLHTSKKKNSKSALSGFTWLCVYACCAVKTLLSNQSSLSLKPLRLMCCTTNFLLWSPSNANWTSCVCYLCLFVFSLDQYLRFSFLILTLSLSLPAFGSVCVTQQSSSCGQSSNYAN